MEELRPVSFDRDFTEFAPGSVLVSMGTDPGAVHGLGGGAGAARGCGAAGKGWVTAEYSLLPGSSAERIDREAAKGKQSGRTQEIQRLIGRSLRAVTDMVTMGELQVTVDCDVLQADGGTRTASICGGYVALHDCFTRLMQKGQLSAQPLGDACAAVSVGIVDGALPARPRLRRGLARRGRHERGDDRVGSLHRGPGHGRGDALLPAASSTRCWLWPSTASPPSSTISAAVLAEAPDAPVTGDGGRRRSATRARLVLATANPDKAREIVAIVTEVAGEAVELGPGPPRCPTWRRRGRPWRRTPG